MNRFGVVLLAGALLALTGCAGQSPAPPIPPIAPSVVGGIGRSTPARPAIVTPSPSPTITVGPTFTPAPTNAIARPTVSTSTREPQPAVLGRTIKPGERWHDFPLGPTDATLIAEEQGYVILESTKTLDGVANYYLEQTQDQWLLFERLRASDTRFDGEALFLVFWKPEEAVCILASNATDMTADAPAKTVLTVSPDCASLRMTADSLRTAPWAAPEWVAWREWQGQGFSMHYPSNWIADTRLAQQPYCQPGTGIRCVGAFMFRNEDVEGIWTVIAKARPPDKSLSKLAIEAWDEGGKAAPSPGWVVAEPVTLDDGTEAVQILSTWTAGDQSGILTSVSVATEKEHYMLAGTAGGKPDAIFAVSELLSAMMRSFHLTGK